MKNSKSVFLCIVLAGSLAGGAAWAQHDRFHHGGYYRHGPHAGVFIGDPLFWPWYAAPYYYPSPYAYPPEGVEPSSPPVYFDPGQEQSAAPGPSNFWYYCHRPDGYYPYVKQCPDGWQKVTPQPPSPP